MQCVDLSQRIFENTSPYFPFQQLFPILIDTVDLASPCGQGNIHQYVSFVYTVFYSLLLMFFYFNHVPGKF